MKIDNILNGALAAAGLAMLSLLLIPEPSQETKPKKKKHKPKKLGKEKAKLLTYKDDKQPKQKKKKIYHVLKTDDGWKVQLEGSQQAVASGTEKKEVIAKAKNLVRQSDQNQLIIHKPNGSLKDDSGNGQSVEDKPQKKVASSRRSTDNF